MAHFFAAVRPAAYTVVVAASLLLPGFAVAQTVFVLPEAVPPPKAAAPKNTSAATPAKTGGQPAAQENADEQEPLMIPMPSVRLRMGLVDVPEVRGVPLERPQSLTVLRHRQVDELPPTADDPDADPAAKPSGDAKPTDDAPAAAVIPDPERSEHLSAIEEDAVYEAPGWITEVALPHPGVYQFILETKPTWTPAQNRFVQHTVKAMQSGQDSTALWERPAGVDFEVVPQTRPFGICAGMSFTGVILHKGTPVSNAVVEAVWLPSDAPAPRKKAEKPLITPVQETLTGPDGRFTITLPWAGWWGFSAVMPTEELLRDPEGRMRPVDQKATIWVPISSCSPR